MLDDELIFKQPKPIYQYNNRERERKSKKLKTKNERKREEEKSKLSKITIDATEYFKIFENSTNTKHTFILTIDVI